MSRESNPQSFKEKENDVSLNTEYGAGRLVGIGPAVLLGAQLTAAYGEHLNDMSGTVKDIFVATIVANGLGTLILTSPPVYSEIAEHEGKTDRANGFTRKAYTAAAALFATSLSADMGIAAAKITEHAPTSIGISVGALAITTAIWFTEPLKERFHRK